MHDTPSRSTRSPFPLASSARVADAAHAATTRRRTMLFTGVAFAACALAPFNVRAAEHQQITVYSAAAVQAPVTELAHQFERSTGHKVHFVFSTAGGTDTNITGGAKADLVINARSRLDTLAGQKLVVAPADLARVRVGVAVRAGGVKPDLSTPETLRASLLAASSIAAGEPAKGATTGIHFATVLDQLGIAKEIHPKLKYAPNGLEVMRMVARGDAELGITQISEIMHIAPATLVGPLPEALQLTTTYAIAAGQHSHAATADAARAFTELLLSKEGQARFHEAGFD
jgi:molybdate transport system substrate-binding protein